jgi:hypothetical protein
MKLLINLNIPIFIFLELSVKDLFFKNVPVSNLQGLKTDFYIFNKIIISKIYSQGTTHAGTLICVYLLELFSFASTI